MTIAYDASMSLTRAMMQWKGTLLPLVLCNPSIYILMTLHVVLLILGHTPATWEDPDCAVEAEATIQSVVHKCSRLFTIDAPGVSILTNLLTFFLVF